VIERYVATKVQGLWYIFKDSKLICAVDTEAEAKRLATTLNSTEPNTSNRSEKNEDGLAPTSLKRSE